MLNFTDIDFNAVWQETFGWNAAGDTDNRKLAAAAVISLC